ncbi:MAG: DNA primase [Tannerella sp.]|jgi:DNA primase|nr:DNA primase [Tannerella sp.]
MVDKLTIDKIYDAAQIVDVVSDFVTLKKRGVNYVGLCPFHEDSTPSFYVSPSKNICKCFACGEGGTSVQFIMKHEQVSYYEALHHLARKYGIEIKEREFSDEEKQMRSDRESMMVVNSWAQKFFTSRLYKHQEGQSIGMPYFVERGFREDIIRKFQLGYGLGKRDDLYRDAMKQGFNESYLLKTGLVYKRDDGTVADRFHGRVIFPIHTLSGKVVAFGGRILSKNDKAAKYVNSPDSEIYHKSYELYGIYFSRQAIVKTDKCYLVEGYTDVISMHQTGVENVVASSGTSLTHGQIRLIRRFTNNITVLYDGDAAGIKAAIRGIDMLLEEGMNVKIVLLPEGEDPDSFARSHNSFDFTLYIKEHEVDFIRFKADLLLKDAGSDPMKRANLIKDMMESVSVIPDHIVRSVYIKECSHLLDEREQVLMDEVIKIRSRKKSAAQLIKEREQNASPQYPPSKEDTLSAETATGDGRKDEVAEVTRKIRSKHSSFKKFESALVRYIVRYGERVLFLTEVADGDEKIKQVVKVAEYIQSELDQDDIEIHLPVYKQMLDEAVARCKDENFVASHYFLTHTDLEISELAADMMSSKYQLSKYFGSQDNVALKQTALTEEQQRVEDEARKKEKEREQIERWVIHDIFVLKNAHVKHEIDEINKQIKEYQSDEEKVTGLLKKRMELDKIKRLLSRELGDRIVTGMGK